MARKVKQVRARSPQGDSTQIAPPAISKVQVETSPSDFTCVITIDPSLPVKITRRKTNSSGVVYLTVNRDSVVTVNGINVK